MRFRAGTRRRLAVLVAVVAPTVFLILGAPITSTAADASSFALEVNDTVLYSGCHDYHLAYKAVTTAASTTWSLTVSDYEAFSEPLTLTGTSGVATFTLCSNKAAAGRFDILGAVDQCDDTGNCVQTDLTDYQFNLREPRRQIKLTATPTRPRFNHVVVLKTRTLIESPGGWMPTTSQIVFLEILARGHWSQLGTAKQVTDQHGYAVKRYRWNVHGPVRLRAAQTTSYDVRIGTSRPVTIRAK